MVNEIRRLFNSTRAKLQKSALCAIGTLIAKRGREARYRRQGVGMKKGLISIVLLVVLAMTAIPAGAQTRYRRYDSRRSEQRFDGRRSDRNRWDRDRSVWDRHRDKITTAAGAGAGALIGAAVGGKKGAIIGAIVGGGGAAAYTYGIRDKDDDRYRYSRRRRY
jgi:hypothetical protein